MQASRRRRSALRVEKGRPAGKAVLVLGLATLLLGACAYGTPYGGYPGYGHRYVGGYYHGHGHHGYGHRSAYGHGYSGHSGYGHRYGYRH